MMRHRLTAAVAAIVTALAFLAGAIVVSGPATTPLTAAPAGLSVPSGLSGADLHAWCVARLGQGTAGLSGAARTWLTSCRDATAPTVGPTPSTPVPTTSSPGPRPTNPPPPPTTAPPSTTPPVTQTPTPTPSSSSWPQVGCIAVPSRCGYPDATNTGVTPGTALTYSAGLVATTPGATYTGLDIHGCVSIEAPDVTIRDSRITGDCNPVIAIRPYDHEVLGTVLDHIDLIVQGTGGNGIAFRNFTLLHSHVTITGDCGRVDGNVIIRDSFCQILPGGPSTPHYDGWQTEPENAPITIDHNTVLNPYDQTSTLAMWTNPGAQVTITNNLLAGGGYSIYCVGPPNNNVTITGNRFARLYWPKGGYWGPAAYCEGAMWSSNIWDDTGVPV